MIGWSQIPNYCPSLGLSNKQISLSYWLTPQILRATHLVNLVKKEELHSTSFEELNLQSSQSDIVMLALYSFQYIHNYKQIKCDRVYVHASQYNIWNLPTIVISKMASFLSPKPPNTTWNIIIKFMAAVWAAELTTTKTFSWKWKYYSCQYNAIVEKSTQQKVLKRKEVRSTSSIDTLSSNTVPVSTLSSQKEELSFFPLGPHDCCSPLQS